MATKIGAGGEPQEYNEKNGWYGSGQPKRFRQNTSYDEILAADIEEAKKCSHKSKEIRIPLQEYAVLRREVMRKNASQKGAIKPINCAYTSNHFYVYSTSGGDNFKLLKQFDIEKEREKINECLTRLGERNGNID